MALFSIFCLFLTNWIENQILMKNLNVSLWMVSVSIFVVSWIIQFIGHEIEGKNLLFLKMFSFY